MAKARAKAGGWWRVRAERRRDRLHSTYAQADAAPAALARYFPAPRPGRFPGLPATVAGLAANYLDHRFDLLGSGWTRVAHGMECRGVEGHRYRMRPGLGPDGETPDLLDLLPAACRREAGHIRGLIPPGYRPIDWQVDFKSGFRWSEATWYRDIRLFNLPGADIKVPWELARMQHLPHLAHAYALAAAGEPGFREAEAYAREFRDQVLDFMAANPPRYGVNWACSMDVGIRIANWLVAHDLFLACGARFDPEFAALLGRSAREHGRHILANLEWSPELRGNHYLADIAGLLFCAAYLPADPETDGWLAFAAGELAEETGYQFHPDGANTEASTAYHRLSAEMVTYCTAILLALPEGRAAALGPEGHGRVLRALGRAPGPIAGGQSWPPPAWYRERLARMAGFSRAITRPDGAIVQIGDNDSGRFLKLHPRFAALTAAQAKRRYLNLEGYAETPDGEAYWNEDFLDHRDLVSAIGALLGREDLEKWSGPSLDGELARGLAGGKLAGPSASQAMPATGMGDGESLDGLVRGLDAQADGPAHRRTYSLTFPWPEALEVEGFPDFGLFIYRAPGFFLSVRCGTVGQAGHGGHAHNDQLAVELFLDGRPIHQDPGTYLYSALPERRNRFRSTAAHATPQGAGREMNGWEPGPAGLFRLSRTAGFRVLHFSRQGFAGRQDGFGHPVHRVVRFRPGELEIADYGAAGEAIGFEFLSDGYGRLSRAPSAPGAGPASEMLS